MIDRQMLKAMRADIDAALVAVGAKYKAQIKAGSARFTATTATFKLEIAVAGADGTIEDAAVVAFKQMATLYGLLPTDLGKTFAHIGGTFTITGAYPRRRKAPIGARRSDGKQFVFPAWVVVGALRGVAAAEAVANHRVGFAPPAAPAKPGAPLTPDLIQKFLSIAAQLSPENLTCDGELPRRQIRKRERALRMQWSTLESQVGRAVSEDEVWELDRKAQGVV